MANNEDLKRQQLINHKEFLRSLLTSKNKKTVLNLASDSDLIALIDVIHWIVSGHIYFPKDEFNSLKKKRKLSFLRAHFESQEVVEQLKKESRKEQLLKLYKLISAYNGILGVLKNGGKQP